MSIDLLIMKEKKLNVILCTIILIFGMIMSFLIPNWQTPDELTHLNSISDSLCNDNIYQNIVDDFESVGIQPYKMEKKERVDLNSLNKLATKSPEYSQQSMMPKGIKLYAIKHLSATLGILLGIILHVPSFWVMQLGEFFALLGYVIIVYFALNYIPIKKWLLFLVAVSPMALQQASSLNYDALLLPLCFFFISYVLYLKYECTKIGNSEILKMVLPLMVITYIKPPYFLLGIIMSSIPIEKIYLKFNDKSIDLVSLYKYRIPLLFLLCIICLSGLYVFRTSLYVQVIYGMIIEWKRSLYLLYQTFITWGEFLFVSSVGDFGWLDLSIGLGASIIIYLLFFVSSVFSSKCKSKVFPWSKKDYIIFIGTFVLLCLIITSSLVNHTIKVMLFGSEASQETYYIRDALYVIPYIGGLQGRYFLPFVMLPFLLFPEIHINKSSEKMLLIVCAMIELALYVYIFGLILNKFWM